MSKDIPSLHVEVQLDPAVWSPSPRETPPKWINGPWIWLGRFVMVVGQSILGAWKIVVPLDIFTEKRAAAVQKPIPCTWI